MTLRGQRSHNFQEFVSDMVHYIYTYMVSHTWPSSLPFYIRFRIITLQGQIMVIEFSTGCISYTKDVITSIFRNTDINFEECS